MKHYVYTNDRDGRRGQIFPPFFAFVIWNEEGLVSRAHLLVVCWFYNKMNFLKYSVIAF